jgi:epoxide hydrolase-like predicted phosphatase
VLFDFGGVFISSPFAAVETAAQVMAVEVEVLTRVVFGSYHDDTDHPWHRLERGEVSLARARHEITALAQAEGMGALDPISVLAELAGSGLEIRDEVVDAVRRYRDAGLRTGIVTNNIAEFGDAWRSLLPIDDLFDDVVDSSAVGVRKPDVRIFEIACERLDVAPADAAFIDDHEGNVAGARRAGLRAVCCGYTLETTRAALAELDRLALG